MAPSSKKDRTTNSGEAGKKGRSRAVLSATAVAAALAVMGVGVAVTGGGNGGSDGGKAAASSEKESQHGKASAKEAAGSKDELRDMAGGGGRAPSGTFSNRVVTWNLHGPGRHSAYEQARQIAQYRPGVIGFQEACKTKVDRIARALKKVHKLDYHVTYGTVNRKRGQCGGIFKGGAYGQAMLTAAPAKDAVNTRYSRGGTEPRGYMAVTVPVAGKDVRVFNTHFAQKTEGDPQTEVRAQQARELEAAARPHNRAVVLGDFNTLPSSSELAPVWQHFADADPYCGAKPDARCQGTIGTPPQRKKLDFILLRRGAFNPPGVGVHDPQGQSDHSLVHADLKPLF
ncbi:endonuclease/exonuclease/phosphatase family protein [Streptomyces sp. NBC_01775]|uniref:endonuclease/exonuclease/phosphatase family protein n=1 Tax=Streptomyces sp. NBC_01775 TaxID=2975939 RepID=UPI002DDB7793|nr:endonuclease/exonuclease/phosphatase family protein [Streptomyces sp. NBC_01775]WSB78068.1 endonuclease/exonuclease/phosphatase family protein [Streptomyces sp. NBC_01775]